MIYATCIAHFEPFSAQAVAEEAQEDHMATRPATERPPASAMEAQVMQVMDDVMKAGVE